MICDNEWITSKDLLGVGGLPTSLAGLHKRARSEGWEKRSVSVQGIRGRTFAYRLKDLPPHVQYLLGMDFPANAISKIEGKKILKSKRTPKEWFTLKELSQMDLPGMSKSVATLNRKANREQWEHRQRQGGKGVSYEYHVSALPSYIQKIIYGDTYDDQTAGLISDNKGSLRKISQLSDTDTKLLALFSFLNDEEKQRLIEVLGRNGAVFLTLLLDTDIQELHNLEGVRRIAALSLRHWPEERVREIFKVFEADEGHPNLSSNQNCA